MNVKPFLLLSLAALLFIAIVKAPLTSNFFAVTIGDSIVFQNNLQNWVRLDISSGLLNSSRATTSMNSGGGHFIFTALNDSVLRLTHNVTTVRVGGDSGNEFRQVYNGNSFTILTGNAITINWSLPGVEPWLPVMFILGMTGLVSLFGGALYTVDRIKKKLYQEGLINGVIFVSIGFALFISWLWA